MQPVGVAGEHVENIGFSGMPGSVEAGSVADLVAGWLDGWLEPS